MTEKGHLARRNKLTNQSVTIDMPSFFDPLLPLLFFRARIKRHQSIKIQPKRATTKLPSYWNQIGSKSAPIVTVDDISYGLPLTWPENEGQINLTQAHCGRI